MRSLISGALRQNVFINVVFVALAVVAAVIAVPSLPVDRYPNINFGEVEITTSFPGAAPEEVEVEVTQTVEDAIRDMENLEYVRSTSLAGMSMIRLKFIDDTDYNGLYDELRLRVLGVQNNLPVVDGEPLQPTFNLVTVDEWLPVIQANLVSADPAAPLSRRALTLLGKELRTRIEEQPGVKKVVMLGDSPQWFDLVIDPKGLERHGVTLTQVAAALRGTGMSLPAGAIDTAGGERLVRVDSRYRSRDDLLAVVVRLDGDGTPVTVGQLIDPLASGERVADGSVKIAINGQETVAVKVLKLSSASAPTVKAGVEEAVAEFREAHQDSGVSVVFSEDNTLAIADGMGVLADSLILSVILVMVLLFTFLGNRSGRLTTIVTALGLAAVLTVVNVDDSWLRALVIGSLGILILLTCRAAVLTVSGIAFSFLGALLCFWILGYSLNEITLMGFVLVSGIIVDDAIVVLENIQRHREDGKPIVEAAIDGTAEVFWPVVSATLTTMAAFLPMLLMTGAIGEFFALVPIAVAVALGISLIEALIILPLHAVEIEQGLGPDPTLKTRTEHEAEPARGPIAVAERIYGPLLRWNLRHPFIAMGAVSLLFLGALAVVAQAIIGPLYGMKPILKLQFFPDDMTKLMLRVDMPMGTALERTDALMREMAEHLVARGPGQVRNVTSLAGLSMNSAYLPEFSNQKGMAFIEVPTRDERDFDSQNLYLQDMRQDLEATFETGGVALELQPMQGGPPTGAAVNVRVTGVSEPMVLALATDLEAWMRSQAVPDGRLDGVIDLATDRSGINTVWSFVPDRRRTAELGLTDVDVQAFIAGAVEGAYVGEFRRSDGDIPVRVRLPEAVAEDLGQLLSIPLADDPSGRVVRFPDLGHLQASTEPSSLVRRDFQRTVTIVGNIAEDSSLGAASVVPIIREWYQANAAGYPGAAIAFGGEAESTGKSYASLGMAFILAVILIYAILAGQFRSYLQPLLIMSNIVFSFTGVVLAMAAFGIAASTLGEQVVAPERAWFTVNSFIAIIGLTGLVINDAIVLIDFINRRRAEGLPVERALIVAGHQRMRPIILTTLTTIAGLLPMAAGIPDFSITWGPFATSFIAGLALSTVMTLLVVPVLYLQLERTVAAVRDWFGAAAAAPGPRQETRETVVLEPLAEREPAL